jgi:hypothetical protein
MAIDDRFVVALNDRPTTLKERYIGRAQDRHPQQMIRVDYEVRDPIGPEVEAAWRGELAAAVARADLVLISDYAKGVCTPGLLAAVIAAACERPQVRAAQRVPARLPAMVRFSDGTTAAAETRDLGRDGASIALRGPVHMSAREKVWLSLFCFDAEQPLPAEILDCGGRSARIRFTPLSLEQEAHLVRAIFSRADAWLGWTDGHRRDRPLLTLLSIARHGVAGVARALALSVRPRPRALPARVPVPVRGEA